MKQEINEKELTKRDFVLNTKHVSDTFRMYEKDNIVLEASFMTDGKWTLREKIDHENSKYIADVSSFEEVSNFNFG
jgi:hypothetical protein